MEINSRFSKLASISEIKTAIKALEENGIRAIYTESGEEAKKVVLTLIPNGAEVFTMTSVTLETIGLAKEINESGNYNSVRKKLSLLDSNTQKQEMAKLGGAPEYAAGSVHAVTQDGKVLVASNTGSQLGAYAYGARHVIWVVGAQKIVRDVNEGIKRIYEYSLPLENERAKKAYGTGSNVSKILILNKEVRLGRITIVIVRQELGF